jgi:hypothetical protein
MTSKTVSKRSESATDLNPRTKSYEFLGPPGAFLITLVVPITTYALYFGCSEESGGCPPKLSTWPDSIVHSLYNLTWWKGLWDTQASLIYVAWYMFCVAAWAVLPGDHVEGVQLRTGGKKKYKINGAQHFCFLLSSLNSIQRFRPFFSHWG